MDKLDLRASEMWEAINRIHLRGSDAFDLSDFRRNALNTHLSTWEINSNAMRFFKTMLFNAALELSENELQMLDRIEKRDLGDPILVRTRGRAICIEYLHAVLEASFLSDRLTGSPLVVMEIGAGFGRTCHALLSIFPAITRYVIVDLTPCLNLARRYLAAVLPAALFAKIVFMTNDQATEAGSIQHDLAVNINSMAEMPVEVVRSYLRLIEASGSLFFCKNPVGKFSMACLEQQSFDPKAAEMALKTGVLTGLVDIFDADDVEAKIGDFLDAYRPAAGWEAVKHCRARPWSYYHQALFARRP